VLLLHGGPGVSAGYVDALAAELATRFDTVWHQQRGVPPSAVGGPYSVGGHVDDALTVLDACELERAWIVGHSWGGFLAMAIAAAAPDRCLGYAAIDSCGPVGDGGMEAFKRWIGRALDEATVHRLEELDAAPAADEAVRADDMAPYWHACFADATAAPTMPPTLVNHSCHAQVMDDAMRINASGTLLGRLRALEMPAVFVAGSESGLRPAAEAATEAIHGSRLRIVDGAGHLPWLEVPGSALAAVVALASASDRAADRA
jgi:pimeloyl-ACP methyl ester carboxylesterase